MCISIRYAGKNLYNLYRSIFPKANLNRQRRETQDLTCQVASCHHQGGIKQGRIVADGDDRNAFVTVAEKTGTAIYAWALLDNHVHILLKSGQVRLPTCMRKLLSWYAQYYNPTDSEFVKTILDETEEQVKYQISERDHPEQAKKDIEQVCTESALTLSQFCSGGRMKLLPCRK